MKYIDEIKQFFQKMSKKTRTILGISVVALLAVAIGAALILNHTDYQSLFSGLNDTEAREIMAKLQDSNVAYRYQNGEILVDKKQVDQTKATLVNAGYPKSGFTYDVFTNNTSLMTTDYEKRTFKLYELQDRIASTINLFDGVKFATVTIALGEDQKYVLNSTDLTQASASVVVEMNDGGSPTKEQVAAIQDLVSKSIPQMTIDHVGVFDGNGNDVTVKQDTTSSLELDAQKTAYQNAIEDSVESKVLKVLLPFFGPQDVVVSVKSKVNLEKKVTETIDYTAPLEDKESGIISNQQLLEEYTGAGQTASGVPGTDTNADIPQYDTGTNADGSTYTSRSSDTNYLVNQRKEQNENYGVELTDLTISVAVNAEQLDKVPKNSMIAMVGNASGIAPDLWDSKITIVNAPFYQRTTTTEAAAPAAATGFVLQPWMIIAGAATAGVLLILIIVLSIMRARRRKKQREEEARQQELEDAQAALLQQHDSLAQQIAAAKEQDPTEQLVEQVREFTAENPDISAQLLKSWLRGGGTDHED